MNDSGRDSPRVTTPERLARERIDHAVSRARLVLFWESFWPVASPFIGLAALFAIVSWFGLWRVVSDPVRYAILLAFAVGLGLCFWRVRWLGAPTRNAALARVETATGVEHRPATAFGDRIGVGARDSVA